MKKIRKQVSKIKYKPLAPLSYDEAGSVKRVNKRKKKMEDIPLYHAIQIGAGYNADTGEHTQMNMYISDELMKASEEDRTRRMAKTKKIEREKDFVDVKNGE